MTNLLGLHDLGGEHLFGDSPGWIVDAIAFSETRSRDYRAQASRGFSIISRLNWAWNPHGTIPEPARYGEMARICAEFVTVSPGCNVWIVGNEFNHRTEFPNGRAITPEDAAACHRLCYAAIKQVQPSAKVLVAAVAPWYDGEWLNYLRRLVRGVGDQCDGYALHATTHGADPALVFSDEMVNGWYWHFRTYRQQLLTIVTERPAAINAEFHITESNQGDNAWVNANSGWVQNAAREIHDYNQQAGAGPFVRSLCLYRWGNYDKWRIDDKPGVQEDFRGAIGRGYQSPPVNNGTNAVSEQVTTPHDAPATAPQLPPYPAEWDPRLTERGVKIERVLPGAPGTLAWVVTKGVWMDEQESGGRHHFYADVYADNRPVVGAVLAARWPGDGYATFEAEAKPGNEPMANFPMSKSLNEFSFQVNEPKHPSDRVTGVGMGANGNPAIHTSTYIEWTLYRTPQAQQPAPTPQEPIIAPGPTPPSTLRYVIAPAGAILRAQPTVESERLAAIPYAESVAIGQSANAGGYLWTRASWQGHDGWIRADLLGASPPAPVPAPEPAPPATTPTGDDWPRIYAFIKRWEGGWADHPNDPGGATNKGVTFATFKRWRESRGMGTPTLQDLRALTDAEQEQILYEWYYKAAGADKLPWPVNLAQADTAVNAGVGRAQEMLQKSGGNFLAYMGHLIDWYTRINNFEHFGRAWIRRRAEILLEAAK